MPYNAQQEVRVPQQELEIDLGTRINPFPNITTTTTGPTTWTTIDRVEEIAPLELRLVRFEGDADNVPDAIFPDTALIHNEGEGRVLVLSYFLLQTRRPGHTWETVPVEDRVGWPIEGRGLTI